MYSNQSARRDKLVAPKEEWKLRGLQRSKGEPAPCHVRRNLHGTLGLGKRGLLGILGSGSRGLLGMRGMSSHGAARLTRTSKRTAC